MATAACSGPAPGDVETVSSNLIVENSLTANSLTANSLTANSLTANGLRDPLAREFLTYVVSCALDEGASLSVQVENTTYRFDGSLGLAPGWGQPHGSCDGSCQRWVSACVLARVDATGTKREISIRGANFALWPTWNELVTYTDREATYFGNVFVSGQPRFLCLSPGKTSDPRVCGPTLDACPMTVEGSCAEDCANTGLFGGFGDCSDAGRAGHGHVYHESITVFLPR